MFRGLTVLVGYNASLLSDHILFIDTSQIYVHCFPLYTTTLIYTIGLQYRLHGVPSAWVFVSGMIAEA